MNEAKFKKWIQQEAKNFGYRRKGQSFWLKITEECILFINLQKDAPFHYINLGVLIRSIVPNTSFETFKWNYHCLKRADVELGELLNTECEMNPEVREAEFRKKLSGMLIPQLDSMGSLEGIKKNIESNTGFIIAGLPVKRLLGLPLGPRFTYHQSLRIEKDGTLNSNCFELWERFDEDDAPRKVATVYTIKEAEDWINKN